MEESSRSLPPCSVASAACVNACQDAPRLRVFTIHALLVISISSSSSFKVRLLGARRSAASGNRIRKQWIIRQLAIRLRWWMTSLHWPNKWRTGRSNRQRLRRHTRIHHSDSRRAWPRCPAIRSSSSNGTVRPSWIIRPAPRDGSAGSNRSEISSCARQDPLLLLLLLPLLRPFWWPLQQQPPRLNPSSRSRRSSPSPRLPCPLRPGKCWPTRRTSFKRRKRTFWHAAGATTGWCNPTVPSVWRTSPPAESWKRRMWRARPAAAAATATAKRAISLTLSSVRVFIDLFCPAAKRPASRRPNPGNWQPPPAAMIWWPRRPVSPTRIFNWPPYDTGASWASVKKTGRSNWSAGRGVSRWPLCPSPRRKRRKLTCPPDRKKADTKVTRPETDPNHPDGRQPIAANRIRPASTCRSFRLWNRRTRRTGLVRRPRLRPKIIGRLKPTSFRWTETLKVHRASSTAGAAIAGAATISSRTMGNNKAAGWTFNRALYSWERWKRAVRAADTCRSLATQPRPVATPVHRRWTARSGCNLLFWSKLAAIMTPRLCCWIDKLILLLLLLLRWRPLPYRPVWPPSTCRSLLARPLPSLTPRCTINNNSNGSSKCCD